MEGTSTEHHIAAILNAAWMVRHYARGARVSQASPMRAQRARAIHELGLVVRRAFAGSDDFEPLLGAVVDGLRPQDQQPF